MTFEDDIGSGMIVVRAMRGAEEVGRLVGDVRRKRVHVVEIEVQKSSERRQGIATSLYERAAQISCRRFGKPLASDTADRRNEKSTTFWQKQANKGRARQVVAEFDPDFGVQEPFFTLRCPAPTTLRGHRR